jgi:hypothetical protein
MQRFRREKQATFNAGTEITSNLLRKGGSFAIQAQARAEPIDGHSHLY